MIEFISVTKDYGRSIALDDFSVKLTQRGIYCLLGRNGAGKTTFMKALAGHIPVTRGKVTVDGKTVSSLAMPNAVHFVESGAAHFNIRLADLFKYAADINPNFDLAFAEDLARRFKLDRSKKYRRLSFGMKAMVNTLIALASGKEILLLDEPVLGFDPIMRKTFYEMLGESCAEKPKFVIVSTHIIDEIEKTAEKLIIIDKGRPVLFSEMNEIDEKAYSVTGLADFVKQATEGLRVIGETKAGGFLSRYVYDKRIQGNENINIAALGLTDFFVGLVGDENKEGTTHE
jgi:ABC-2 type transport system ATP-binding protein